MKSRAVLTLALAAAYLTAANTSDKPKVTYTRDVASILNRRCVECHRAGEVAPMAFSSYKEVPPWFADPHFGEFKNDRRLSQQEMDAIAAWVAAGAPEGDSADLPPSPQFLEGWTIGKPDLVIDFGTDFEVPTTGVVPYQYFKFP